MGKRNKLEFKVADLPAEFEEIHRLNYETFVQEIPQHSPNNAARLVDSFHDENTYIICKRGARLLAMIAVRGKRPFSLDRKVAKLDDYLPPNQSLCEVRLLSIRKDYRSGLILRGLLRRLYEHCEAQGYTLALISGVTRQLKLYRHIGFVPFGPVVGSGTASFQPMYITKDTFHKRATFFLGLERGQSRPAVNLLPGPVALRAEVQARVALPPISHRSAEFHAMLKETKSMLCAITGASGIEILTGSGTLANDAVGAQLFLRGGKGLILSNGEFGERLIDHGRRYGLHFDSLSLTWGEPFTREQIASAVDDAGNPAWLWAVHCETSSGMLLDLPFVSELCRKKGIALCLDCVSSLAVVPVDLRNVALASASSGKALRAFPGLSMVFYNNELIPGKGRIPRYLDLAYYKECEGVPFTTTSNLQSALNEAVRSLAPAQRFQEIKKLSRFVRRGLSRVGIELVGSEDYCSPAVITLALPSTHSSLALGELLDEHNFLLSYRSQYLVDRNWLQICLMGELSPAEILPLFSLIKRVLPKAAIQQKPLPAALQIENEEDRRHLSVSTAGYRSPGTSGFLENE